MWNDAYQSLDMESLQDNDEKVVACLEDAGWPGFIAVWGGGIEYPLLDEDQMDVARAALKECAAEVNGDTPAPTSAQIETQYNLELAALECLKELDYEPVSKAPSLQRYIETYGTGDHWAAYLTVVDQIGGQGEFQKAATACPDPGSFPTASLPSPEK